MTSTGAARRRWSAVLILTAFGALVSHSTTARAAAVAGQAPRFFVPDFRSGDDKNAEETSWVALAVSEGLRARLRRSGATTAVSDTRTAGVTERLIRPGASMSEALVRIGRLLGVDWAVMGSVTIDADGTYYLKLGVLNTKSPDPVHTGSVSGPSVQALLDGATQAVLAKTGVKLAEEERKRIANEPGGSASAVEYYAKAVRAVRAGKPNDALYYVAESRRYQTDFRPTLKLLGQINIAVGNHREVMLIFEHLLRRAKIDQDPLDEIFARTQIAIANQRNRRLEIAEKYYLTALEEARATGLEDVTAVLLGALATLRVDQRKPDEAIDLLKQRLAMLEKQGDRLAMGPACLTMGLVYAARKDVPKAFEYLNRAAKLAEQAGIAADKSAALYQIAELHKQQGELDKALASYQASIDSGEESEAGSGYRQIASIYEQQGKLDAALAMLRKAESILSARKAYAQQADCLARSARIYAKRKDYARAIDTMTVAVEILSDLGHRDLPAYKKELAEMQAHANNK